MLQQTRVEAVIPYYTRFLQAFADVQSLAGAELEQIYKLWEGLGYYTRPRMMQAAAKQIVAQHGGIFPQTAAELAKLPGIGDYTAGAVASICFGEPVAAVDGNVLRVFARLCGIRESIQSPSAKRQVKQLVMERMPKDRAGDYNQAIMELGALVCLPKNPNCTGCPIQFHCEGYAAGDAQDLPIREPKKDKKLEKMHVGVIVHDGCVLVRQRGEGLLGGLWEFPHGTTAAQITKLACRPEKQQDLPEHSHVFTHKVWQMKGALYRAQGQDLPKGAYRWADKEALMSLPIPTAMGYWRKYALEEME